MWGTKWIDAWIAANRTVRTVMTTDQFDKAAISRALQRDGLEELKLLIVICYSNCSVQSVLFSVRQYGSFDWYRTTALWAFGDRMRANCAHALFVRLHSVALLECVLWRGTADRCWVLRTSSNSVCDSPCWMPRDFFWVWQFKKFSICTQCSLLLQNSAKVDRQKK